MDSVFQHYRDLSIRSATDFEKGKYSDSLRVNIEEFLKSPGSFHQPLGKIRYLGDIYSPDGAFRMITWNNSLKDGTYNYICFVQMAPNKNGESIWHELKDHHKTIRRPETKRLDKENWYGALYYSIIPFKRNKTICYALLGWEGNNKFSNKKIVECLTFTKSQEPVFEQTAFKSGKLNKRRIIFEYSKEAYLMLRYNEDLKTIIFNRLEPPKPELKGLYSYYQPSTIFDGLKLQKQEWVTIEDINPRNKKNNKIFIDPSKKKNQPKID